MLQHSHVSCFLCSAVFRLLKTAAPYSKRAAFIRRPISLKFDLLYSGFSSDSMLSVVAPHPQSGEKSPMPLTEPGENSSAGNRILSNTAHGDSVSARHSFVGMVYSYVGTKIVTGRNNSTTENSPNVIITVRIGRHCCPLEQADKPFPPLFLMRLVLPLERQPLVGLRSRCMLLRKNRSFHY